MYSGDQNSEYPIHNGRINSNTGVKTSTMLYLQIILAVFYWHCALSNPNFFNILYLSRYANF